MALRLQHEPRFVSCGFDNISLIAERDAERDGFDARNGFA